MSLQGIPTSLQIDPRLVSGSPEYTITKGSTQQIFTPYTTTNYSSSLLSWSILPNNMGTYLDRKILVEMEVDFTLTAVNPLATIFPGPVSDSGVIGLRYMPLHNVSTNFQTSLNGTTLTYPSYDLIPAMTQYNTPTPQLEEFNWSAQPSMKNCAATFADTFGTPRSQFASRYQNTSQDSNATTSNMSIISQVPGSTVVRCKWAEYLCYPPFVSGLIEKEGLIGLNSALILTWTLPGLERMIGYDNVSGEPLSSITAIWAVPPVLHVNWLSSVASSALSGAYQMAYKYPYSNIQSFASPPVAIASGATTKITTNNIQMTGIPQCVYVYARQQNIDRTPFDCDAFGVINNINIQFNNMPGILSSASSYDLYKICVRNGLKQRYSDWASIGGLGGVGSVLRLEFDRDISLAADLAVAISGTFQFVMTMDVRNPNPAAINYVVYVLPVYEGILTVMDGQATTQINMVSKEQVMQLAADSNASNQDVYINEAMQGVINGGSIVSQASNFIKKGQQFYANHKDTIHKVLSISKNIGLGAAEVLPVLLGLGLDYDSATEALIGHGFSGGSITGGRLISEPSRLLGRRNNRH